MDEKKDLPELLTIRYICSRLQIHPNTLRQWEKKGLIKCFRIGVRGDRRYLKADVLKMFQRDYRQQADELYAEMHWELQQEQLEKDIEEERRKEKGREKKHEVLIRLNEAQFEARKRLV